MKVWLLWFGGSSYGPPSIPEDLEEFPSLRAARESFEARAGFDPYYPCVSDAGPEEGGPEAWIFFERPGDQRDPYPDRILYFGPRGGVRIDRG